MQNVTGKTVVVTGASSGLGAETVRQLVKAGANVVFGARRTERLRHLCQQLELDDGAYLQTDVTDKDQVKALVDRALERHDRIDVMLNNAGVMPLSPIEMLRVEEWESMIDINVKGVLYGIAAALPYMKEVKRGQIINVASVAAHIATPGAAVYCATKHSVRVISEAFRQEVKPYNIRSTIISPGAVDTELPSSVGAQEVSKGIKEFYKNTAISADNFARCVLFAISQPEDVDINEILFRPTSQTF